MPTRAKRQSLVEGAQHDHHMILWRVMHHEQRGPENPTLVEMSKRNRITRRAEYLRSSSRVEKRPGDVRAALELYDEAMLLVNAGLMSIKAIPSLESQVLRLEETERRHFNERQLEHARRPRKKSDQPDPLADLVRELDRDNSRPAKELWLAIVNKLQGGLAHPLLDVDDQLNRITIDRPLGNNSRPRSIAYKSFASYLSKLRKNI